MDKLMIIDGSSLLFRAFYGVPPLTNKRGIHTNAVYGFLNMLYRLMERYEPKYICVAFDRSGPTIRHESYADYKGTRDKAPDELSIQFTIIKEILRLMGVYETDMSVYEADDIAGTLAKHGQAKGLEVMLVTGDKDYLQLVDKNTSVYYTKRGITDTLEYNIDKIKQEYGIEPKQLIDVKALMGDSSDNIPGVPGVGEKTALKLIKEYGSLDGVYENIDEIKGKLKEKLVENKKLAYLSKELGRIFTDIELGFEIEDLTGIKADYEKLREAYLEYELSSLMNKLPIEGQKTNDVILQTDILLVESRDKLNELIEKIKLRKQFTFKFLSDENDMFASPIYIGIKPLGEACHIIKAHDNKDLIEMLKEVFENGFIKKLGSNIKPELIRLIEKGWEINGIRFDAGIAAYLLDPAQYDLTIQKIAQEYTGYVGKNLDELLGKGKKRIEMSELNDDLAIEYLALSLEAIERVYEPMLKKIKERQMDELFYEIEMPLVEVLAYMEHRGVEVDESVLNELGEKFSEEIHTLIKNIYTHAGGEFNINSTKQLGEVLFEKLGLPTSKKTKTGYSTNVEVLEGLRDKHEIVEEILRYRQLVKLQSTYIEGLKPMINKKTGRIHTIFNQTLTTTGRISSTEPNLQNIPIRTEEGRQIRKAFIAKDDEHVLLDADYSQIELRILAHIAEDKNMIAAFNEGEDIHTKTARDVFLGGEGEVTKDLRYKAKAVNFGIVYGISDFSLSQDIGITRKEAKTYIDSYFENFKAVKHYMEETVKFGKENGYVETLLHRRRYIKELASSNFNVRSFGERIAMNTPIQGTAADVIKKAMVLVHQKLKRDGFESKLILTIHDELIIEAKIEEKEEVKKIMVNLMEGAIKLDVPLKVEIEEGRSWYDTK